MVTKTHYKLKKKYVSYRISFFSSNLPLVWISIRDFHHQVVWLCDFIVSNYELFTVKLLAIQLSI